MSTPINVLINGVSLIEYFDQVSIQFSEGLFCNSINISVKDKQLWDLFDPIANFGILKLKVILGEMTYEFLTEERSTEIPLSGVEFSAWGRSAQALLDKPYSKLINDDEEKIHPWQLRDCSATEIINYAIDYCCSSYIKSKTSVNWNVEDFIVYKDSFTTSYSTPIDIISSLAGIIGAELVANADGSLTVQEYSVAEGVVVQEYNDVDHIVSLNDDIVYPIGYNSVTVNGFGTGSNDQSAFLTAELQEDDLDGWEYGKYRPVRCYYYHPKGLEVDGSVLRGSLRKAGKGRESFTEWVLLVWGTGNTEHPNLDGISEVKGNEDTPLEFVEVTYQCRYQDFQLASYLVDTDEPPYGVSSYYFTDRSNTQTLTFEYFDKDGDLGEQPVIQLDWDQVDTDEDGNPIDSDTGKSSSTQLMSYFWRPGIEVNKDVVIRQTSSAAVPTSGNSPSVMLTTKGTDPKVVSKTTPAALKFRVWGDKDLMKRCFDSVYNSLTVGTSMYKEITEELGFSGGEANISRPYKTNGSVRWLTPGGGSVVFTEGMTSIKIASPNPAYPFAIGEVKYKTEVAYGSVKIPKSYTAKEFYVHLEKVPVVGNDGKLQDPEYLSISHTVTNEDLEGKELKTIAVQVKDFATDVVISGARVTIDGVYRGSTNGDGLLTVNDIIVGDHTIKIISDGYLDSDEDELANDTFTVS